MAPFIPILKYFMVMYASFSLKYLASTSRITRSSRENDINGHIVSKVKAMFVLMLQKDIEIEKEIFF